MTGSIIFCQICLYAEDPFAEEGRGHEGKVDGGAVVPTNGVTPLKGFADLVFCKGNCCGAFHRSCVEDEAKKQLTKVV